MGGFCIVFKQGAGDLYLPMGGWVTSTGQRAQEGLGVQDSQEHLPTSSVSGLSPTPPLRALALRGDTPRLGVGPSRTSCHS